MDDEAQSESSSQPIVNAEAGVDVYEPANQYVGGFFPKAEHFTVSGGTFKNVSHIHNAPAYRDFRMIPPGDLDLRHEKGHSVVYRRGSPSVRRVYSSQIHGSSKAMTAVVFQGDDANERLREEISQYTNLRHPQILQLYGVVNARGIHATIFHDDLIPYRALRDRYRTSHFSTVYFWACLEGDFSDVDQYMATGLGRFLHWSDYTVWIRSSTGRLCLELTASGFYVPLYLTGVATPDHLLLRPPEDLEIAASMSLEDYHEICHWHLCQFHQFPIYTTTTVNLGSIRRLSGAKYRNSFEIAISHEVEIEDFGWAILDPWMGEERYIRQEGIVVMENAWMRVDSCDVYPQYRRRICTSPVQPWSWLAQANHIVDRLGISYNPADYFLTDVIHFWLTLNETRPPGYLFLCPLTDLQTDTSIGFRTPECAAYWSFNPSGADRLSPDEARRHGFPHLRVQMEVWGKYWDSSVYAGIREFHKAKGFDPYSQQVAIELGCPPFEITCDPDLLRRYADYYTEPGHGVECSESHNASGSNGSAIIAGAHCVQQPSEELLSGHDMCSAATLNIDKTARLEGVAPGDEFTPSPSWNALMFVQLSLILALSITSMYDYVCVL